MRDQLLFAVVPYVVALAFLPVCAVRYFLWRPRPRRRTPPDRADEVRGPVSTAARLALAVVALGHVIGLAFPEYLLLWNRQLFRLVVLEGSGVLGAVIAISGLGMSWIRAARAGRRHAQAPVDVVAKALVLIAMVSGLGIAMFYRWASVWSAVTLLPYLRSLAEFSPWISLVTHLPPLVKLHVACGFAILAVLPFTETARTVMARIDGLARQALAPLETLAADRRAALDARIAASVNTLRTRVLRNSAEEN